MMKSQQLPTRLIRITITTMAVAVGIFAGLLLSSRGGNTSLKIRIPQIAESLIPYIPESFRDPYDKDFIKVKDTVISFTEAITEFEAKLSDKCLDGVENKKFCPLGKNMSCIGVNQNQLYDYFIKRVEPVPLVRNLKTFLFDFERDLLRTPPLTDMSSLPSPSRSRLHVAGKAGAGGEVRCGVGGAVRMRVELVDSAGGARGRGQDDVRAWAVEVGGAGRRMAGDVEDHGNGTYSVRFLCLWAGSRAKLHVAVAYPREYLRRTLEGKLLGVHRFISALFKSGKTSEATPCFSTPNLPWPCLCNFTSWNTASFYCGRPRSPGLGCQHLAGIASGPPGNEFFKTTRAEAKLMAEIPGKIIKKRIQKDFFIVTEKKSIPVGTTPCSRLKPNVTWGLSMPKGYFDRGLNWRSILCTHSPMTASKAQNCLRNTKVMLFGDSNGLRLLSAFWRTLSIQKTCRSTKSVGGYHWNFHQECHAPNINMTVTYDPHEYHLHLSSPFWPVYRDGGVASHMARIPATGRHVVIVHYFAHIATAHLAVYQDRLVRFREAVKATIKRNPDVVFAIRGPHVISTDWADHHSFGGDTQGVWMRRILEQTLSDVQNHVFLLDGWDMSLPLENDGIHPTDAIPRAMITLLLGFVCK